MVYEASEEESNWAIALTTLKDVLDRLGKFLNDNNIAFNKSSIDVLAISKN